MVAAVLVCGHPFVFILGHLWSFWQSSLFVGGHLHCLGCHGLLLALGISPLAIAMQPLLWYIVQSSVGGLGSVGWVATGLLTK